jgi:hypothetical protein
VHSDLVLLSRLQFAVTVMFHYLFPPLTIGLGALLVYMEWKLPASRARAAWERATRFFVKLFAVNFVMGVATGIVHRVRVRHQLGERTAATWATCSAVILAAEGLWAFFLESGFLAILVFGWDRVTPAFHFFATLMVAIGSRVQRRVDHRRQQLDADARRLQRAAAACATASPGWSNGQVLQRAVLTDFFAALLNPSTANRISHVLVGALVMGGLFVHQRQRVVPAVAARKPRSFSRAFGAGLAATAGRARSAPWSPAMPTRAWSPRCSRCKACRHRGARDHARWPGRPQRSSACRMRRRGPRRQRHRHAQRRALHARLSATCRPRTNLPGLDLLAPKDRANANIVFWSFRAMVFAGSALLALLVCVAAYCVVPRHTTSSADGVLWACVGSGAAGRRGQPVGAG